MWSGLAHDAGCFSTLLSLSFPVLCPCSIRVLPHHQDTGGFFIAVMEKLSWLPWQSKAKTAAAVPTPVPPAVVDTPPTSGDNVPMGTDGIGEEEMKGSGDEEKGDAGERQDGDSSSGGMSVAICVKLRKLSEGNSSNFSSCRGTCFQQLYDNVIS